RASRCLAVDAHDAKMTEYPEADLTQAAPGDCRHGKSRIAKSRELQERPQLGVRVGETVRPVGEEQRGKPQREGILVTGGCRSGRLACRLPAVGERNALLAQDGVSAEGGLASGSPVLELGFRAVGYLLIRWALHFLPWDIDSSPLFPSLYPHFLWTAGLS